MQHRKNEKVVIEEDSILHLVAMPIKDKDSSESGRLCRRERKPAFTLNSMVQRNPGLQRTGRRRIRQWLLSQTCPGLKLSKGQLFLSPQSMSPCGCQSWCLDDLRSMQHSKPHNSSFMLKSRCVNYVRAPRRTTLPAFTEASDLVWM